MARCPPPTPVSGGLNFTYNIGPGSAVVELAVQHDTRMRKMWNVVGTLKGAAEPDRWVILRRHSAAQQLASIAFRSAMVPCCISAVVVEFL